MDVKNVNIDLLVASGLHSTCAFKKRTLFYSEQTTIITGFRLFFVILRIVGIWFYVLLYFERKKHFKDPLRSVIWIQIHNRFGLCIYS